MTKISNSRGLSVAVTHDNVERALRKFKKKVQEAGTIKEVRDRQEYTKPTTVRKRKAAQAQRRWQKKLAKEAVTRQRLY